MSFWTSLCQSSIVYPAKQGIVNSFLFCDNALGKWMHVGVYLCFSLQWKFLSFVSKKERKVNARFLPGGDWTWRACCKSSRWHLLEIAIACTSGSHLTPYLKTYNIRSWKFQLHESHTQNCQITVNIHSALCTNYCNSVKHGFTKSVTWRVPGNPEGSTKVRRYWGTRMGNPRLSWTSKDFPATLSLSEVSVSSLLTAKDSSSAQYL
jgi:hypothetical protein